MANHRRCLCYTEYRHAQNSEDSVITRRLYAIINHIESDLWERVPRTMASIKYLHRNTEEITYFTIWSSVCYDLKRKDSLDTQTLSAFSFVRWHIVGFREAQTYSENRICTISKWLKYLFVRDTIVWVSDPSKRSFHSYPLVRHKRVKSR